jgi:SAM-dependent methyltransferase
MIPRTSPTPELSINALGKACILCGGQTFDPVAAPWRHSMTTAGALIDEPLSKAQCRTCGLLQRIQIRHLGETDFYERHYSFYERPGAAIYDQPRYAAMAKWIGDSIASFEPQSILDAGCGRGWMMEAVRRIYPNAVIEGVEPSEQESENARKAGFKVIMAKVTQDVDLGRQYDLVYSTNVVEHTTDPVDFLRSLKNFLREKGLIVIVCPDSSIPSAELMFSDQNYSFTPQQFMRLAESAGLNVVAWKTSSEMSSVNNKQLVVLSRAETQNFDCTSDQMPLRAADELLLERCRYVESYTQCDRYLLESISGYETIYNFGTSTWSLLLAAYCPNYWSSVSYCVIEGESGLFQGKVVKNLADVHLPGKDVFVLGVNPLFQPELSERLAARKIPTITWNHVIKR